MYYAHFGLKEPPFKITPNTEFFFSGGNRGAILDALMYAVTSGEGIVKVVGEVGSGKTMICRMLQTQLPEHVESVYLANPSVAPEDVLHAIAFELQLPLNPGADRLQVMQVLQKYLLDRHAAGKQVVIFVEEAQGMPLATLEEIRLLSNLETKHDKLLQIVLFGQPELDVNLNANQIRQLRERITHSFNLGPLDEKSIGEYLIFRLRAAGYYGPHLFTNPAIALIAKSAQGLVRRVNILADKALLAAFSQNVYQVGPKHVRAAIRDSEFGAEQIKRTLKNRTLIAVAATLLVGLVAGYLINIWLPNAKPTSEKPKDVHLGEPTPARQPVKPVQAVEAQPVPIQNQPPVEAITTAQTPLATAAESPAPTADPTSAPAKTETPSHAAGQLPVSSSLANEQAKDVKVAVEPKLASPRVSQPNVAPASQSLPVQAAPMAQTPEPPAVDNKPSPKPVNGDILQTRLDEAQSWLKQQPASTYTIQLFGSGNDDQLKHQLNSLAAQVDQSAIYPYHTQVNGKPFISVLYGSFANKDEALQAVAKLPANLKAYQPHLRTIGGILKETNQFQ